MVIVQVFYGGCISVARQLYKCRMMIIRVPFDAPSSQLTKNLGWMSIADLISFESKQLVCKS